jgi:hypothetical protein
MEMLAVPAQSGKFFHKKVTSFFVYVQLQLATMP